MIYPDDYPPEQRIGAIPEELFVTAQSQEVRERIAVDEEHELEAYLGPGRVYFVDTRDSSLGLDMNYKEIGNHGIVEATVRTRWDESGERRVYPGLYARRLVGRTIMYFDSMHGPARTFMHQWDVGSDNRNQYEAALSVYDEPSREQQCRAALATWSGTVSIESGFRYVIGRPYDLTAVDGTKSVVVEFTRLQQSVTGANGLPKRIRRA